MISSAPVGWLRPSIEAAGASLGGPLAGDVAPGEAPPVQAAAASATRRRAAGRADRVDMGSPTPRRRAEFHGTPTSSVLDDARIVRPRSSGPCRPPCPE